MKCNSFEKKIFLKGGNKKNNPYFERNVNCLVAKFPGRISAHHMQRLLEEGICWPSPNMPSAKIYNVDAGSVYEFTRVDSDVWQGYPFIEKNGHPVPRGLVRKLAERAIQKQCETEFIDWTKEYMPSCRILWLKACLNSFKAKDI